MSLSRVSLVYTMIMSETYQSPSLRSVALFVQTPQEFGIKVHAFGRQIGLGFARNCFSPAFYGMYPRHTIQDSLLRYIQMV